MAQPVANVRGFITNLPNDNSIRINGYLEILWE